MSELQTIKMSELQQMLKMEHVDIGDINGLSDAINSSYEEYEGTPQAQTSSQLFESNNLKRFNQSVYKKYFEYSSMDTKSVYVKCIVKSSIEQTCCATVLKLQKDTYNNLRRHLLTVHDVKAEATSPRSLKQPTLEEFKESKLKYPPAHPKQKRFVRNVIDCFAMDGMPFDTVEKIGFPKLVLDLDARIDVKSRRFFMRELETLVNSNIMPELQKELLSVESRFCHFSCDVWTSKQARGVLCILAHFIDTDWRLQKRVLLFEPLTESHTGCNIRRVFLECLAAHGVPNNWGGIVVTDNASNMKSAFNLDNILEDDEWTRFWSPSHVLDCDEDSSNVDPNEDLYSTEIADSSFLDSIMTEFSSGMYSPSDDLPIKGHLTCVAHTLQLAINDAIRMDSSTKEFLKYVNRVMVYFKRSTKWRDELRKICKDSPKRFVPTRWNSYLSMLQQFGKDDFFAGVRTVLDKASVDSSSSTSIPDSPSFSFLSKAKDLSGLLAPLGDATDKLQSDACTSNLLVLTVVTAFKKLTLADTKYYMALKQSLLDNIKERMEPVMRNKEYILAAVLDPRIKMNVFRLEWSSRCQLLIPLEIEARTLLDTDYAEWAENFSSEAPVQSKCTDVVEITDDPFFGILAQTQAVSPVIQSEIETYLMDQLAVPTICPLMYWNVNASRFKVLSLLARKYLAVPASSAGVERIFSFGGWFSRAERASISSENISRLLMVREDVERKVKHGGLKGKYEAMST